MNKCTVAYGLIPPQSGNAHEAHILPITKIIKPKKSTDYFLTCGRDGAVIKHTIEHGTCQRLRMQVNSDWVSDIAEVGDDKFIVVSHDFFVCLLTLGPGEDTWSTKIIGYHDDYVKCVAVLGTTADKEIKFATCGLDMKLKVWLLRDNGTSNLLHSFDNAQPLDSGSLYALVAVDIKGSPFDLIAGDNNGNIILMSSDTGELVASIQAAHDTNIKLLHLMDEGRKMLSTSSDGILKLWDVQKLAKNSVESALIHTWKWASPVWCVEGAYLDNFFVGDSRGAITQVSMKNSAWDYPSLDSIVLPPEVSCGGVLAMQLIGDKKLWYSYSGDSNLSSVILDTRETETMEGGFALLRCSLLTNRRHVITQNTNDVVQRWDILSCELLDTFDASAGSFDEIVISSNPKEVLPHWCSVSIKTGKLFVTLSPKFLDTEIYGSALEQYKIVNNIEIEVENRYNLGRIAVNSLLNDFITYIIAKDKAFRKELVSKKSSNAGSPALRPTDLTLADPTKPSTKEKRRLSLFTKFGSSEKQFGTPSSIPGTPVLAEEDGLSGEDHFILPPPATAPLEGDASKLTKLDAPRAGLLSKRSVSSGSLLTQKLKMFSYNNNVQGSSNSDADEPDPKSKPLRSASLPHTPVEESEGMKWSFVSNHQTESHQITDGEKAVDDDAVPEGLEKKPEYLSDFLAELRKEYVKEYEMNASSFKLLGRKTPASKIKRENNSPVIEIATGVLLLVNCWKEGSCGDTVSYSTYLPAPQYAPETDMNDEDKIQIFQNLERNLPYWMAKALFKDEKTNRDYPKVTFILRPWQDPDSPDHPDNAPTAADQAQQSHHHHLSFHRNKHIEHGPKPLPTVPEAYTKLHAPSMIKVKKVLLYVVDRFETKTPEMKAKTPVQDWLELVCKGQVLDNELALSSVKTLYWKSQGDIILEYRRKATPVKETK
ncbi:LAQU0S06e02102g1_1 [Lachancea quebecensis]|uniref:LAQU0S06e02102g1_1 n=1 Tax=Lachancea quebecensis TaxID=1654605 RepID=A0A0P1KZ13_9SACH|nr:LAQU0S06e02102g1_1 [Lachancea quebecensis]